MTDLINLNTYTDILNPNVNQDVVEALDKFTQSSITSKELKEKTIESIFLLFVNKLTLALQNTDYNSLTDLILNKSSVITEQTGKSEWPLIETLKVQNFDPLAIYIYNYLRFKHFLRVKLNKEILPKAFDNLYMLLMKFVEKLNTPFSDEVLWAFFNDLFELYVKIRENSIELEEIDEKIDNMKLEIDEVTNINGILSMENIEPNNHKEYIVGVLFLLFNFRIDCLSSGKGNEVIPRYKNLFKRANSNYLRRFTPIIHLEIELLLNLSLFFSNDLLASISNLVDLLKFVRLFRKFKKNLFIIDYLNLLESFIKQFIAVFVVCSRLRINEFIKQFLGFNNEFVEGLGNIESKGFENILTPSLLAYMNHLSLLSPLNIQAEKLRIEALDNRRNEEILNVFYKNIITSNDCKTTDNLFEAKEQFNKKFNQIHSLLNK